MIITPHDTGTYLVKSRTEDETHYIVDINELTCSCPAFMEYKTASAENPCAHLEETLVVHHRAIRYLKALQKTP